MKSYHLWNLLLLTLSACMEDNKYLHNELDILIKLISASLNNLEHVQLQLCLSVHNNLHKIIMMIMRYRGLKLILTRKWIPLGGHLSSGISETPKAWALVIHSNKQAIRSSSHTLHLTGAGGPEGMELRGEERRGLVAFY